MTSYLITFPNLFERKLFEETKQSYFNSPVDPLDYIIVHSNRFIEIKTGWFFDNFFIKDFPNCKIVRKITRGKKVNYECLNKGSI